MTSKLYAFGNETIEKFKLHYGQICFDVCQIDENKMKDYEIEDKSRILSLEIYNCELFKVDCDLYVVVPCIKVCGTYYSRDRVFPKKEMTENEVQLSDEIGKGVWLVGLVSFIRELSQKRSKFEGWLKKDGVDPHYWNSSLTTYLFSDPGHHTYELKLGKLYKEKSSVEIFRKKVSDDKGDLDLSENFVDNLDTDNLYDDGFVERYVRKLGGDRILVQDITYKNPLVTSLFGHSFVKGKKLHCKRIKKALNEGFEKGEDVVSVYERELEKIKIDDPQFIQVLQFIFSLKSKKKRENATINIFLDMILNSFDRELCVSQKCIALDFKFQGLGDRGLKYLTKGNISSGDNTTRKILKEEMKIQVLNEWILAKRVLKDFFYMSTDNFRSRSLKIINMILDDEEINVKTKKKYTSHFVTSLMFRKIVFRKGFTFNYHSVMYENLEKSFGMKELPLKFFEEFIDNFYHCVDENGEKILMDPIYDLKSPNDSQRNEFKSPKSAYPTIKEVDPTCPGELLKLLFELFYRIRKFNSRVSSRISFPFCGDWGLFKQGLQIKGIAKELLILFKEDKIDLVGETVGLSIKQDKELRELTFDFVCFLQNLCLYYDYFHANQAFIEKIIYGKALKTTVVDSLYNIIFGGNADGNGLPTNRAKVKFRFNQKYYLVSLIYFVYSKYQKELCHGLKLNCPSFVENNVKYYPSAHADLVLFLLEEVCCLCVHFENMWLRCKELEGRETLHLLIYEYAERMGLSNYKNAFLYRCLEIYFKKKCCNEMFVTEMNGEQSIAELFLEEVHSMVEMNLQKCVSLKDFAKTLEVIKNLRNQSRAMEFMNTHANVKVMNNLWRVKFDFEKVPDSYVQICKLLLDKLFNDLKSHQKLQEEKKMFPFVDMELARSHGLRIPRIGKNNELKYTGFDCYFERDIFTKFLTPNELMVEWKKIFQNTDRSRASIISSFSVIPSLILELEKEFASLDKTALKKEFAGSVFFSPRKKSVIRARQLDKYHREALMHFVIKVCAEKNFVLGKRLSKEIAKEIQMQFNTKCSDPTYNRSVEQIIKFEQNNRTHIQNYEENVEIFQVPYKRKK